MFELGLSTLVTYNPTVVAPDATLETVEQLFERHDIRHAPVVDNRRRVVGIVSLQDLQRAHSRGCCISSDGLEDATDLRVEDVMKSPVVTISNDASPQAALRAMLQHGFHSVPVVADEQLVGIVTSSDFLRELSYGEDPLFREPLVKHILSEQAQIEADETLDAARLRMDQLRVDYLAVVRANLPLGYVSRRDLAIAAVHHLPQQSCGDVANTFHDPTPAVPRTARLGDGVRTLLEKRSKVVLVVDRQNHCRGLLTVGTALAAIAGMLQHEPAATTSSTAN
jgi:CBS domain-containing protein